ncbi:MAG: hypothetical protein WA760_14470, partial [Pseudolabrys sp.]
SRCRKRHNRRRLSGFKSKADLKIATAAASSGVSVFLQRVASDLELHRQSKQVDVDRAIATALHGLIQQTADGNERPAAMAGAVQATPLKFSAKLTHRLFGVRVFSRSD